MNVGDLSSGALASELSARGVSIEIPPFVTRVRTDLASVARGVSLFYSDYRLGEGGFADFHIELSRPRTVRRWLRPQVDFLFDGTRPFKPLPLEQAYPMFEWGLNWCIANHSHQYLMLHAAVIERDGRGAILPGPPGSGKSTLVAGLVSRGWRLLSDELALISPKRLDLTPVPRPISLKNESIDAIRAFEPSVVMGPIARDTRKGDVTHVKPPPDSVHRAREAAIPAWVVFPRFVEGQPAQLEPISKARAVVRLAENAFNFAALGESGFECLTAIVDRCTCRNFAYSRLDEAIDRFATLAQPGRR